MRILRGLVIVLIAIAVIALLAGLFLPKQVHVERGIVINAPAEKVFAEIANFKRWERWSPWYGLDPDAIYTYSGSGVGAVQQWKSEMRSVGSGKQTITALDEPRSIETALEFEGQGSANARFQLEPEGPATRVTWGFDADFTDDYMGRYFGMMLDSMVGADFERGLDRLKKRIESDD